MLSKDIREIANTWGELSPIGKVTTITLSLLSLMSIASISDSVYQFKGFLASGVDLYRAITLLVFSPLLEVIDLELSQSQIDSLVVLSIGCGASINESLKTDFPSLIIVDLFFISVAGFLAINLTSGTEYFTAGIILAWAAMGFAPIALPSLPVYNPQNYRNIIQNLAFYFLIVCILAGISEGLSRTN